MRTHGAFTIAALAWALSLGCKPSTPPTMSPDYTAVFEYASSGARGSVAGDFGWASESSTWEEATNRWGEFLAAHGDGELEDAFHGHRVEAAKFELARAYYVLNRIEEGDSVLRELVSIP